MTFGGRTDCSCQFIASLTNAILSLWLTKTVKRSLILCNVLQLDYYFFFFYLLPDLTVNLWFVLVVPNIRHLPNRTDWRLISFIVRTALMSNMLISSTLTFFKFDGFFLAVLIRIHVVTEAQFLCTQLYQHMWVVMIFIIQSVIDKHVGRVLGSTLPTCDSHTVTLVSVMLCHSALCP